MLERIIELAAPKNGVILDPFCGCGTAVYAAQKLGLEWIGIDITHLAVSLIERRIQSAFPKARFDVIGVPKDIDGAKDLSTRDKYQFQWWATSLIGAKPFNGKKKGADGGIDGIIYFKDDSGPQKKIIVSVKGGANVGVGMIREFENVIHSNKAAIGIFICLVAPTKPMIAAAAASGYYESSRFSKTKFPRLQIITIQELLNKSKMPIYPDFSEGDLNFKEVAIEKTPEPKLFD